MSYNKETEHETSYAISRLFPAIRKYLSYGAMKNYNLVFGPYMGDLYNEILYWAPLVRLVRIMEVYKNTKLFVITKRDRIDLYMNKYDDFFTYDIEDEADIYPVKGFTRVGMPLTAMEGIIERAEFWFKRTEPSREFRYVVPAYPEHRAEGFIGTGDFLYDNKHRYKMLIENFIRQYKDKIPIVINSYHRNDEKHMNWGDYNWRRLFNTLERSNKYLVFVSGLDNTYYFNPPRKNFVNLHDFVNPNLNTNIIGLTMEAMKQSKITVGLNPNACALAITMKCPIMYWGPDADVYSNKLVNITKVKRKIIKDVSLSLDPTTVFQEIPKFIKELKK